MNSDTLVEYAPGKLLVSKATIQREILKEDMMELLSPDLNMGILFGLPILWKEMFMEVAKTQIQRERYLVYESEIESWLFSPILTNKSIFNVGQRLNCEKKLHMGVKWWFSMFQLSRIIHKVKPHNRLRYIRSLIYKYMQLLEVKDNIKVIIDPRLFQESLITKYQEKFKLVDDDKVPKFTILLIDIEFPIIMLWQDDENVCSFNLNNLNKNDFYSQTRFITTIQVFIEETATLENVDLLLL